MSHRYRCITIVYCRIEFVTWISSIVTLNLSRGYRLSPHRICQVDIVYRHIVIGYRRIDVVTCSSSHNATFRATVGSGYKIFTLLAYDCRAVSDKRVNRPMIEAFGQRL